MFNKFLQLVNLSTARGGGGDAALFDWFRTECEAFPKGLLHTYYNSLVINVIGLLILKYLAWVGLLPLGYFWQCPGLAKH